MKLRCIMLCVVLVVSVYSQKAYATEGDITTTHSEESTHGEESHDEESTHGEESHDEESTHGEESHDEESTHGEESHDEESTHSEEVEEENEYSADDYTDNNEDNEENTECNNATDKDARIESTDILDKDYIGDYRSFSFDTSPEDEIGYLSVIANTLTDMHITIIVQNIIICAFLIYIFVSRMTRVR